MTAPTLADLGIIRERQRVPPTRFRQDEANTHVGAPATRLGPRVLTRAGRRATH